MKLIKFSYGIRDQVLERHLAKEVFRIQENAKEDIGIAISQNVNDPSGIAHEVSEETEVLKSHITKSLNPEIDKLDQEITGANLEALYTVTAQQVDQIDRKVSGLEVDIKRTKLDFDWSKFLWVNIAIIALNSIDAGSNYSAFQVLTKSLLGAIILSLAVAFGLTKASHVIASKIGTSLTGIARRLWFAGAITGAGIVFYLLGTLRQTYMGGSHSFSTSPLAWMLFNLFFFTVALLLSITMLPSKEQKLAYTALRDKKKQLNALKREKEALLADLAKKDEHMKESSQKLEAFRKYRDELLLSMDKERNRMYAMCLKEFELKGGKTPLKVLITSKNPL